MSENDGLAEGWDSHVYGQAEPDRYTIGLWGSGPYLGKDVEDGLRFNEDGLRVTVQRIRYEEDSWVIERMNELLDRNGEWVWKMRNSEITDEFRESTRYPLAEAVERAYAEALAMYPKWVRYANERVRQHARRDAEEAARSRPVTEADVLRMVAEAEAGYDLDRLTPKRRRED